MIGVEAWLSRSQGLLADLGDAGLPTGLGEQLKVLRLLQLLEERGGAPNTPDELARWVAPVMCSRSDQFEPLRRVLSTHFVETRRVLPFPSSTASTTPAEQKRRYSLAWSAAIAVAIVVIGAAIYYLLRNFKVLPNFGSQVPLDVPEQNIQATTLVHPGVAATLLTVVVAILLWRRINLAVRHGRVTGEGTARQVRLDAPEQDKDNPLLLRAARMLNRPQLRPTGKLDVSGTVHATAEAGGRFSPTELIRRVPATWMLLVERGGAHDPTPEFGARLSLLLTRSGVRHTFYEFRRSPEWVRRKGARDGPRGLHMPLERALATDRPTRTLVLAEATSVVDQRTDGPARWLNDHDVPSPVLLTPNAMENWSAKEAAAAQAGVLVLPADPAGLTSLARRIQADDLTPTPYAPGKDAQFEQWQAERFTWLSQTAPAAEVRKKLVATLQAQLGTKEFLLLVGVAAFPEVRLDLMATLDRKLHPRDSASEQRFRLLTLGRMVWLKESIIPDWLRHDLMGALPRPEMRSVREAWMVLLADKPRPGKAGSTLAIHLAEGTAEAGALGDGLFLGFMRGQYDLPAPLRWGGLAALWRAPDRTELVIAGAGVAGAIAAFIGKIDIGAELERFLRAWHGFMQQLQTAVPPLLEFRPLMQWAIFGGTAGAVYQFHRILLSKPEYPEFPRFLIPQFYQRFLQSFRLPRPVEAIFSTLVIVTAGWLNVDFGHAYQLPNAALDFSAPLILAVGLVLLRFWPLRPAKQATVELGTIVQNGRGTGLSDHATMLALLWLFSAGLLLNLINPGGGSPQLASGWLIAIAVLGLARALLIWWSDAQLQSSLAVPGGAARDAAIGLVLGQLSGVALAWMFLTSVASIIGVRQADPFLSWHLTCGLTLLGSAVGISAALRPHGLIKDTAMLWAGVAAFAGSVIYAALFLLVGTLRYASFTHALGLLPFTLLTLLVGTGLRRIAAQARTLFVASTILCLPACIYFARAWSGVLLPSDAGWLYALPLAAAVAMTWPLIQRLITNEPSLTSEPPEWRPRPVHPWLWVLAPLLLLTALQPSIGTIALDLPSLVIPLAIVLAWRFGLRGYRTALLMALPALWYYVPYLLTWVNFAPLQAILPAPSQYALPSWVVPLTLDAAASALLIAALFARPALFAQIRTTSQLPWWGVGVLILLLCVQVTVPGIEQVSFGGADLTRTGPGPAPPQQQGLRAELFKDPALAKLRDISGKADAPSGTSNVAAPSNTLKRDTASGKTPVSASGGGNYPDTSGVSSFGFRVPLGWSSETLLVLTLFLFAISRARAESILVMGAIGAAGFVSFAYSVSGVPSGMIRPLPVSTPVVALIAYGIGRYFERIASQSGRAAQPLKSGDKFALFLILIGAVTFPVFLAAPWILQFQFFAAVELNLINGSATFISLFLLLTWTLGVRIGTASKLQYGILASFGCSTMLVLAIAFFFGSDITALGIEPPLLAAFLPLTLFFVGTRCREAVATSAQETAATIPVPELQWLAPLRRWIASISERVRPAVQAERAKPDEAAPGGTGSEQPMEEAVQSETLNSGNADRPPPESVRAPEPIKETAAPRGRDDWSFTLAVSHYPYYPQAAALPGAEAGAVAFNNWVTDPLGGRVPVQQAVLYAGEKTSAEDATKRLMHLIQQATERNAQGPALRRLYLYFAGYVSGTQDDLVLVAGDAGPDGNPGSFILVNDLVDRIRANGLFSEVILFIDGRSLPIEASMSFSVERHAPTLISKLTYFSIAVVDRSGPSANEGRSAFAMALIDGLRGAATNTSSRITNQSLGSYVTMRLSESQTKPWIRYHGQSTMVIAEAPASVA